MTDIVRYAIFNLFDNPFLCCICGENKWTIERKIDEDTFILTCSHGTVEGLGFRKVDSVNSNDVFRAEELESG